MFIYLDIVPEFSCACCGSCCRNEWLVTVDEAGYGRNREFFARTGRAGEFAAAFRPLTGRRGAGEYAAIAKGPGGGCWFLRDDNLCLLHREAGHEHLDGVCRLFPRYPMRTARGVEVTLSFSCPEVLRLVEERTAPLAVVRAAEAPTQIGEEGFTAEVFPRQQPLYGVLGYYFELEQHFIDIMQCRGLPVAGRLVLLAATAAELGGLPPSLAIGREIDGVIRGNYARLDAAEAGGAKWDGPADVLAEHFFVNMIFKKVFYLHGLAGAARLLRALGRRIAAADVGGEAGRRERVKAAVMAAEFEYCHNREALLRLARAE